MCIRDSYRKADKVKAHVLVGIRTKSDKNFISIKNNLKKNKFKFKDLTSNQISNDHLRHMVGGRIKSHNPDSIERIFRAEFPERPGALLSFLESFGSNWNISLFHYRNLGSSYGSVLMGIEDNSKNKNTLLKHLNKIGLSIHEETSNPAYKDFLK